MAQLYKHGEVDNMALIQLTSNMTSSELRETQNSNNIGFNTAITSVADYIIERGTTGIWTYEKWASGKTEIWTKTACNYTENDQTGNPIHRHPGPR